MLIWFLKFISDEIFYGWCNVCFWIFEVMKIINEYIKYGDEILKNVFGKLLSFGRILIVWK